MKTIIATLAIAACAPAFAADWWKVNEVKGKETVGVDKASIRKVGNVYIALSGTAYDTEQFSKSIPKYNRLLVLSAYDCANRTVEPLQLDYYLNDALVGAYRYPANNTARPIKGSIGEATFNFVCSAK